jgi:hypothetical protein
MKSLTSYFDQPSATVAPLWERCIRAVNMVACVWMLLSVGCQMFSSKFAPGSPAHLKLQIFQIGCLLLSAGIYSVLFPLWFILRRHHSR